MSNYSFRATAKPVAMCATIALLAASCAVGEPQPRPRQYLIEPPSHAVGGPHQDRDGDGVSDRQDACPATPAGATAIWRGCAAVEIVQAPGMLFDRILADLDERRTAFGDRPAFADTARRIREGQSSIESSAAQLRRGQVCEATNTYARATAALRLAESSMAKVVQGEAARLLAGGHRGDDVRGVQIVVAFLKLMEAQVNEAIGSARAAARVVSEMCASLAGPWTTKGRVVDTNDAAGLVQIDNASAIGLVDTVYRARIYKGRVVSVSGVVFRDGTSLATRIEPDKSGVVLQTTNVPSFQCLELRIAPIQPFAPYSLGPYTLHHPKAYEGFLTLDLELGMRLGVADLGCSGNVLPDGSVLRASMSIDVEQGGQSQTIALDLQPGDHPVALPPLVPNTTAIVKATVVVASCKMLATGTDDCGEPWQQAVDIYPIFVRPRGFYSNANYETTTFSVTDNGVSGDFETTRVVGVTLSPALTGTNATFQAEGYPVANGVSTRPQVEVVIQGQPFAIYEDDFFDPDALLFELERIGVDRPSGLRWPRVVGTRNGKEFQYSSTLPSIVRDRVNGCASGPDTYYKIPFSGEWPKFEMVKGNFDDEIERHSGVQDFAFDFGAKPYTNILAARGGRVTFIEKSRHLNASQCASTDAACNEGNFMFIRHEDGTYGVYFHMVQNGVLVNVGDRVHRGDHIAEVGNTGTSSGPHLHFESGKQCPPQECSSLGPYTSIRIRFEVADVGERISKIVHWTGPDACHIPRVGSGAVKYVLTSTQPEPQ